MEIIKPIKVNEEKEEIVKKVEQEEKIEKKPIVEQIKELNKFKAGIISEKENKKGIRIPRKAKVRKGKLKKGYIGILRIDENRNITGEKVKVAGNAYMTSDGSYHAIEGNEMLFWEGKFPLVIQKTNQTRPLSLFEENKKSETFGDRYKMAKMLNDTIRVKSKGGSIIIWVLVAGAALYGINYMMGGSLFG